MGKRAEDVERTRHRIVEAAVHLHGTLGPRATTMSDVAARAGVTRATLYRHFQDEEVLFAACSAHWAAQQRPPDPTTWTDDPDASVRLRTALADVYRFYAEAAPMLRRVTADHDALPQWLQRQRTEESTRLRMALLAAAGTTRPRPLATGVAAHVLEFTTWESLVTRGGVRPDQAVELMAGLLEQALA